ncbi:MAG: Mth938-like domain-containing protein [Actinobacteria bacterium]|nr:Mth938-like domain-containing protein [Actinomycetota bacterium]
MAPNEIGSPLVACDGWGFVEVEGVGRLRDAKLWPGGGRGWDWNETGTHHQPGIQPGDLAELLDHSPDVVVLSRGRELRLETSPEAVALLEGRGIEAVQVETGSAIETYNRLAGEGRRVAALLHTTC